MRSVITFWWYPEEEAEFLHFVATTGPILAVPFQKVETMEELKPQPIMEYIKNNDPRQLFLGLAEHINEALNGATLDPIVMKEDGKMVRYFRIADMQSCVIGYRRGQYVDCNTLTPSNLYAYYDFPSSDIMTKKSPIFVAWAKKVFRWVYKETPEWHQYKNYRVSKRVKEALLNSMVQIAPY